MNRDKPDGTQSSEGPQPADGPQRRGDLLGYSLGLLTEAERAEVRAAFADRAELDATCERIVSLLRPLDADRERAPTDLAARVMARIDALHQTIPLSAGGAGRAGRSLMAGASLPSPDAAAIDAERAGHSFSIRDLIGLAAAILIFVGIFVPGYQSARRATQRTICANNLRQIGNAVVQYAESNASRLPLAAGLPVNAAWAAGSAAEPAGFRYMSNSQNLFPLVQQRYIEPQHFICVARPGQSPLQQADLTHLSDFPSPRNNSYSASLLPQPWTHLEIDPNMPIASDLTPLVDDDRRLVGPGAPEHSISHGRLAGQNVLRANISVIWTRSPRVGLDNDDIYRVVGVRNYTGVEQPRNRTDAFLIP